MTSMPHARLAATRPLTAGQQGRDPGLYLGPEAGRHPTGSTPVILKSVATRLDPAFATILRDNHVRLWSRHLEPASSVGVPPRVWQSRGSPTTRTLDVSSVFISMNDSSS